MIIDVAEEYAGSIFRSVTSDLNKVAESFSETLAKIGFYQNYTKLELRFTA